MVRTLPELIAATSELPALPSTTVRLLDLLEDATVEAAAVLEIIEKDPALTANLLKLCNSAYYGLRRRVGSVREALVMLGNQTVLTLAFATSMGDILRGSMRAYRLEQHQLWHHSLATAFVASALLPESAGGHRERAFTAGLVHDIGKLLLDRPLGEQLQQLPRGATPDDLLAAERSILGYDHARAGAALARAWNFPADLVTAIACHHAPERAERQPEVASAVAAANLVALAGGFGGGLTEIPDDDVYVRLETLGVPADTAHALVERLPRDLENLLSMLGETA
ncbi:MAG: HDOD domain-containing protein [Candidatus Krumholzibacteriia bacterium]